MYTINKVKIITENKKKLNYQKIYVSVIKLIHELAIIMSLINYKNVITQKLNIFFNYVQSVEL